MTTRSSGFLIVFRTAWPLLVAIALIGCTTKPKANARARAAFVAGQQQALAQNQQPHEPSVTVIGNVQHPAIPWTEELTLAKAVIAAGYSGSADPSVILIIRNGQEIRIDPKQLLSGEDVPLQAGDILEIRE